MKKTVVTALLLSFSLLAAPKPSGPLKVYEGPEGEVIAMVEVNDSKEMAVLMKGIGGEMDGRAVLYTLENEGPARKNVFTMKKKGSKTNRSYLLGWRDGQWEFYHPTKPMTTLHLAYSKKETEKMKIEDVLNAIK